MGLSPRAALDDAPDDLPEQLVDDVLDVLRGVHARDVARPGSASRRALTWALEAIVVGHLPVARVAEALAVAWDTANDAVLAEGRRVLIDDPSRFGGVRELVLADGDRGREMTYRAEPVTARRRTGRPIDAPL